MSPAQGRPLHEVIVEQARKSPDAVAVRQWDRELSYSALVGRASALAQRLREAGVGPEVRVGICGRRTPDLVVAALAVLLAGGAYVPLDLGHPRGRLATIIDDAGIGVVIADERGRELLGRLGPRLLGLEVEGNAAAPPNAARPGNAAYVLYTSGSTGRPKGVVVSHASVMAFVTTAGEYFRLDASCRSIGFAALGFDVSVLDIYVPLARGGSVQLVPDEDRTDSVRLARFLETHQVTWGLLPPALLPLLDPGALPSLRHLLTAGEPAGPEQVARWSSPGRRHFHNWYGPTETTVVVVGTELTGEWDRPLPIGRPLPGCRAHILNDRLEPCPPGVAGELCIGGAQLARGYLGRPAQTAERFVPDPVSGEPGARLYRTGDRAVIEEDGRIGFIGRLDRQVKVQGQRVELGEIESALRSHPRIRHAVVDTAAGPAGSTELIAYLAPEDAPGLGEVRRHCANRLPAYMIPNRVHRLPELPLTVAGKVDMVRLRTQGPGHSKDPAGVSRHVFRTAAEHAVASAWAEAFAGPEPASDEDFFDAGGHSLIAMRLVAAVRTRLTKEIAVDDVFAGRTVAGIARRAEAAAPVADAAAERTAPRTLSSAQRRMWFVERLAPGTPAHNITMAQRLTGPLDTGALRAALDRVAERHEILRWRVPHEGGVPFVIAGPPGEMRLPVEPVADGIAEDELRGILDAEARLPFDLEKGPLWRGRLLRLGAHDHVLAVTIHHIAFDGWSQRLFFRDLAAAMRGELPPGPGPAFPGYVGWLADRRRRTGGDLEWWTGRLAGAPAVLDLPADHARPAVQTFDGDVVHAAIGPEPSRAVHDLARRLGATPYAVMLAAFALMLRRLTGKDDLIIGAPVADRGEARFEDLIGCLVQVLPLRCRIDDDATFADCVRDRQAELAAALTHPDVPLERLVDRLGVPRDLSRNPLVQVLFNMYSYTEPRFDVPGLDTRPLPPGLPGALFDLTLYVGEENGRFVLQAVYNPALFRARRVSAMIDGYLRLLAELVAAPDRPVRLAPMRPADSQLPDGRPRLAADRPVRPADSRLPDGRPRLAADRPVRPAARPEGLLERVLERARKTPDAVAITGTGEELSYRELAGLIGGVAAGVRDAGIRPGDTVAVMAARDTRLPAYLLGVLAAGARWAILDPALPESRLRAQAEAAAVRAVLRCPGAPEGIALPEAPMAAMVSPSAPVSPEPLGGRGYLAFTSGSTGDPKPVVTPEGPLARFLEWYPREYGLTGRDRFALLNGLAHDPLLRDAFTPLVLSGVLHVPGQELILDGRRLGEWLRSHEITVLHLTPQHAELLATAGARLPDVRLVVFAGDRLSGSDVGGFRDVAPGARLINAYGTTETPQVQAVYEIAGGPVGDGPVPVGRGVDGSELLVLADGRPAAAGELGEVVIRGDRLADGYLDPELTKRRFGDRRYRTGDLGRYTPDGEVVLAGRADRQIKVRGHRVELGEIEAAATGHSGVRSAVAVHGTPGGTDGRVLLYAVPAGAAMRAADLHAHLKARLPDHAVPAEVIILARLPLTPNGKIDTAGLPSPAVRAPEAGEALETSAERMVAGVWREVLGLPRIGPEDNFFDVGGDSLAIAQVQARLTVLLRREVPIVDLFRHPSVRALGTYLDRGSPRSGPGPAGRRIAARRARAGRRTGIGRRGDNRDQDGGR